MTDNRTTERVDHPPRVREAIDELMREKDATDNRTTELHEVCGDDRFDLIAKAREKLLDSTNIESRPEEVAVLDSILFRCWQMGWLDQLRDDAATLGSEREKRLKKLVRIYGEIANYFCERFACCDAEFANCKYCIGLPQGGQCELGWCNDESKALGIEQPDYGGAMCEPVNLQELYDKLGELENELATLGGGKLTAEQVMAIAAKHQPDYCSDTHVCFDWQAIADELNATTGGGECEWVIREKWPNRSGDDHVYGYETGCGARHTWWPDSLPKFCPTCGGKVKVVDA